jgi:2-polyprenyl-3-methyl-5-hydroxy-6-metoxy-1,4-benzoquinol methylase
MIMKKLIVRLFYALIGYPLTLHMKSEKRPNAIIERVVEYKFALDMIYEYATGRILDVGTGHSSLPHLLSSCGYDVTATDRKVGWWQHHFNRHYPVIKDDILNTRIKEKYQFITCISTIEHIYPFNAVKCMAELLEQKGYLLLTFPYGEESNHDVYDGKQPFITAQFSMAIVKKWLDESNLELIKWKEYKVFDSNIWGQGNRINPYPCDNGNLLCVLLKKALDK